LRGFLRAKKFTRKIEGLATKEQIGSAAVLVVVGLRKAKVVVGPKDPFGKLEPNFEEFHDAREVVGVGTIFCDDTGPKLHLHGTIGRGDEAINGCPRGGASVFCVLDVVIFEIEGLTAQRLSGPELGIKLLRLIS